MWVDNNSDSRGSHHPVTLQKDSSKSTKEKEQTISALTPAQDVPNPSSAQWQTAQDVHSSQWHSATAHYPKSKLTTSADRTVQNSLKMGKHNFRLTVHQCQRGQRLPTEIRKNIGMHMSVAHRVQCRLEKLNFKLPNAFYQKSAFTRIFLFLGTF